MMPCLSHLQLKGLPSPIHDSLLFLILLLPTVQISPKTLFKKLRHVAFLFFVLLLLFIKPLASLSSSNRPTSTRKQVQAQMASSLSAYLPAIFSTLNSKPRHLSRSQQLTFFPKKLPSLFIARTTDNGAGAAGSAVAEEMVEATDALPKEEEKRVEVKDKEEPLSTNGAAVANAEVLTFKDPRWVGGTWDLLQFQKGGQTDWDGVIDAEARRRKWLEDNPEASSTFEPVVFDTSIVPWWAWVKRYHLPEAELLNGRAAMIGFFMAYFVDSLTGVGLVDQMGNFFCKILLLVSVGGVMLIRKTEDIEKLKKLIDEATFYDKQWQATWQEDGKSDFKN